MRLERPRDHRGSRRSLAQPVSPTAPTTTWATTWPRTSRRPSGSRRADARALPAFEERSRRAGPGGASLIQLDRARPAGAIALAICASLAQWGRIGLRQRKRLADLAFLFSTSATQLLSERFEDPHVLAALGGTRSTTAWPARRRPARRTCSSTTTPASRPRGGVRQWGFVRGGMGRLTETMADAAREAGMRDPVRRRGRADRHARRPCGGRPARRRRGDRGRRRALQRRSEAHLPPPRATARRPARGLPGARSRRTAARAPASRSTSAVRELPYVQGTRPRAACSRTTRGIMELNPFIADMDSPTGAGAPGDRRRPVAHRAVLPDGPRPLARTRWAAHLTIDVNSQPYRSATARGTRSRKIEPTARSRRSPSIFPRSRT